MRQHAHPMRRPARRRARLGGAVALAAVVLAAGAALSAGAPPQAAVLGIAAERETAVPDPSAPPQAAPSQATQTPSASAAPLLLADPGSAAGTRLIAPAHVALDAWPPPTPAPLASLTGYVWPIAHPRLTLPFGPTPWGTRVVGGQLFHDGVDLATFCDDRVVAAHDGVVLAAGRQFDSVMGWVGGLGPYFALLDRKRMWQDLPIVVVVDDGNGYRSVYAHFWKVVVRAGQTVRAGQLIGREGMTGHATGCHLHYSLFSPLETRTFGIEPKVVRSLRLPALEIARVDPLLVLPFRRGISEPARNLGSG